MARSIVICLEGPLGLPCASFVGGPLAMENRLFIEACRDGGAAMEAACRALDAELSGRLLRECRAVVRDSHQANDVLQETYLRIWRRCATFRGDSELLGWVRGILRNAIVDHFRSRSRDEPMEDVEGNMTEAVCEQVTRMSMESRDGPDEQLASGQREACYRRCFARFEAAQPLHAAVMRWIAEDGLANEEIAELLAALARRDARVRLAVPKEGADPLRRVVHVDARRR